jgi:hypothetical protein
MAFNIPTATQETQETFHVVDVKVRREIDRILGGIERKMAIPIQTVRDESPKGLRTKVFREMQDTRLHDAKTVLSNYALDREEAYRQMLTFGFNPMCVVPAGFFDEACSRAGMYAFEHMEYTEDSQSASCNVNALEFLVALGQFFASLLMGTALAVVCAHWINGLTVPAWIGIALGFSLGSWFFVVRFLHSLFGGIMLFLIPKKHLKRMLWPDGHDAKDASLRLHIGLIQVQNSFFTNIKRVRHRQLQPCIAIAPDGFTFSKFELFGLFMRNFPLFTVSQFFFGKKDPILYVKHKSVVVVLDQDGEFLLEKELIALLREKFPLA